MSSNNFFSSIVPAAFLEIAGQGGSAVAFNWWLRAATVNNLSVVIVSDVFYSLFFGLIALVLIIRMVKRWNKSLGERSRNESSSSPTRTSSLSLKDVWMILKSHFFADSTSVRWLIIAGTCDCILSLCESYAAGHIAVITQLFLKASEPIVVWILALKWRRKEKKAVAVVSSVSKHNDDDGRDRDTNAEQNDGPLLNGNDDDVVSIKTSSSSNEEQAEQNNDSCFTRCFISFKSLFTSMPSTRLFLSLLSLFFVGVGIALHFALKIRFEVESGKHSKNPIGFVAMYICSIFGSALYAISFGRYIFLVRSKVSENTDPLDLIDARNSIVEQIEENEQEEEVTNTMIPPPSASAVAATSTNVNSSLYDVDDDNINEDEQPPTATRESIQSFATSTHSRSNNNNKGSNNLQQNDERNEEDEEEDDKIAPAHAISSTDVRVIACALEVTISLILSMFIAPCMEMMPGGVGAANSFSDMLHQTKDGIKALASQSTLLYATVTLLGWAFVYAADSVLNHLSAPLTSLINQLASPLTTIVLLLFPILDASETPEAKKLPEFSFALQLLMKIGSAVMVFVGSVLMYFAEKNYAD